MTRSLPLPALIVLSPPSFVIGAHHQGDDAVGEVDLAVVANHDIVDRIGRRVDGPGLIVGGDGVGAGAADDDVVAVADLDGVVVRRAGVDVPPTGAPTKVEKIDVRIPVVGLKFAVPLSPSTMLLPLPAVMVSAPRPPTMTLLPLPAVMVSSPP